MSYDVSLFSRQGAGIDKRQLVQQLGEFGWQADSANHLVIRAADVIYADMDLAWAEDGGAYNEPADFVNCIQVHIPYAFAEKWQAEVLRLCIKIAEALDWRVYDEQESAFVR